MLRAIIFRPWVETVSYQMWRTQESSRKRYMVMTYYVGVFPATLGFPCPILVVSLFVFVQPIPRRAIATSYIYRADSRFRPASDRRRYKVTSCVSHWLGANLELALYLGVFIWGWRQSHVDSKTVNSVAAGGFWSPLISILFLINIRIGYEFKAFSK